MSWPYGPDDHSRDVVQRLARIERILDKIFILGVQNMSAVDDINTKLLALDDEADSMRDAINAIAAAQATGNQAAIDAAVNSAVTSIGMSVDTVKQHIDGAQAAVTALQSVGSTPAPTPPSA